MLYVANHGARAGADMLVLSMSVAVVNPAMGARCGGALSRSAISGRIGRAVSMPIAAIGVTF